ncbi:MAG: L-serine ammonia-lyase [Pirellula sp.]|jgi:L-serine dehydratase|nr:L-serine ammonia-lyase [Pirellula sp.]
MISIFDLFKVGVGPSSSHTVGPMVGANRFAQQAVAFLKANGARWDPSLITIEVELYGSLALTGIGHATDMAILAGLSGCLPATSEPHEISESVKRAREEKTLRLGGEIPIPFVEATDLKWLRNDTMPEHPNAMRFRLVERMSPAHSQGNRVLLEEDYFSTGGGFVYDRAGMKELLQSNAQTVESSSDTVPFPFRSAAELLAMCRSAGLTMEQLIDANEQTKRTPLQISEQLDHLWDVMRKCIDRGCQSSGLLPGSLRVVRRAPKIFQQLTVRFPAKPQCPSDLLLVQNQNHPFTDPLQQLDWVSLFALAVNEENAAGGKVVTAPTNGAAGVIPAVLAYYMLFYPGANREGMYRFLKTAGAIGLLYKRNASLSAAEMGCQGEVGVACSMAAAGLAACMGGTIEQIENAAEIGMEHNLGLTCDPVRGLVQVPCIERNTMGATKAINAARLAVLYGDGQHFVSLDRVIETMRQTGVDMQVKYKETSLGGLAVNVVDC